MTPLACEGSSELPLVGDCSISKAFVILPTILYVGGIPRAAVLCVGGVHGSSELPVFRDCSIQRFAVLLIGLCVGGIPWPQFSILERT